MPYAFVRPLLMIIALSSLSACVSTTSGGFNVDASEDDALLDYLQLSLAYLEEEDFANVRRHLDNAAAIDSSRSEIYAVWGLLYSKQGDVDLADENFRRAIRLDRSNSQTRNNYAAFLFSNGSFEEAYEQLEIVVQDTEYSARPQAFENLGFAALRLQQPDEAEEAFSRALQLNSNQLRSLTELVDLHLAKNQLAQAQAYYLNYQTIRQFYNVPFSSRTLWQGFRLAEIRGDGQQSDEFSTELTQNFPNALETKLYLQSLGDSAND